MSRHTPGPWEWCESGFWGGYSGLFGPNGEDIVFPQTANDGDTGAAWFEEISDADARLIAAAPDLLEALTIIAEGAEENFRDWVKDGYETTEPIDYVYATGIKARAAISRAETPDTGDNNA